MTGEGQTEDPVTEAREDVRSVVVGPAGDPRQSESGEFAQEVLCNVASDRRAGSPEASRQLIRCGTILHQRERGADEWGGIYSNRHRQSGYALPADGHVAHSTMTVRCPAGPTTSMISPARA